MESRENQSIQASLTASGLPYRVTSTTGGKHTPNSYHYREGTGAKGLASDVGRKYLVAKTQLHQLLDLQSFLYENYKSQLTELFGPNPDKYVKNGRKFTPTNPLLIAHQSHVHVAVNKGTFLVPIKGEIPVKVLPGATKKAYYIINSKGQVFAHGGAKHYGDLKNTKLNAPIVSATLTPTGKGYWLVASDGGVFTFGDAKFYGSLGGKKLNAPIIDIASTPSGKGYWLLGEDYGVFTFGDAEFSGHP